jgi:hypothetical protein
MLYLHIFGNILVRSFRYFSNVVTYVIGTRISALECSKVMYTKRKFRAVIHSGSETVRSFSSKKIEEMKVSRHSFLNEQTLCFFLEKK